MPCTDALYNNTGHITHTQIASESNNNTIMVLRATDLGSD
jgi:hypothetical protein